MSVPSAALGVLSNTALEVPELEIHLKRDLLGRRIAREGARVVLRVGILLVADGVAVLGAAGLLAAAGALPPAQHPLAFVLLLWTIVVLLQAGLGTYGGWDARRNYVRVALGSIAALIVVLLIDAASVTPGLANATTLSLLVALPAGCVSLRAGVEHALRTAYRYGIGCRRVLVLGDGARTRSVMERLGMMGTPGIHIVGYAAKDGSGVPPSRPGDALGAMIEAHNVDVVVIPSALPGHELGAVLQQCFLHGVMVSMAPMDLPGARNFSPGRHILGWPLVSFTLPTYHLVQLLLKRSADFVLSGLALLLLLPLFIALALAVFISSPGPVFFRQNRPGLGGRPFPMLKFRTMCVGAEAVLTANPALHGRFLENGCKLPVDEDPRIFRVGRFLRRSSLDELPQLVNVFVGDMSLVGPRPVVGPELAYYGEHASTLLSVKPGITGYWQISGRSRVGFPDRARMDLHYINNRSFSMDVSILLKTVPAVVRQEGAF